MKKIGFLLLLSLAFAGCVKDPVDSPDETHTYTLSQKRSAKRGVAQNSWAIPETDVAHLAPGMSWTYNWGSGPISSSLQKALTDNDVEFCPMAWNNNYNAEGLRSGGEWILGFNEPNLTDQCNMTPQKAAEYWPALVKIAKDSGKKLVSPAMNYGTLADYHDPVKWLDEFFALPGISIDDIDAIALHCYMPSAGAVKNFIELFRKYGKPIWLTEFCNGNGSNISEATQLGYLCETLNMLEQNDLVERYSWFMGRGGFNSQWHNNLLQTAKPFELTTLGTVYTNLSSFDDSVVYHKGDVIPAEQYCYAAGQFHLAPSTDGGVLDLTDFSRGSETRYHINLPSAGTYKFKLRYQTYMESKLSFGVEGALDTYNLQNTSHEWITETFSLTLPEGDSDLILRAGSAASIMINWILIQ